MALWWKCRHRSWSSMKAATFDCDDLTAASVKVCSKYRSWSAKRRCEGLVSASLRSVIPRWSLVKLASSWCKLAVCSVHAVNASSTAVMATTKLFRFSIQSPRISATLTDSIEKVISVSMSRLSWTASTFLFLPPWKINLDRDCTVKLFNHLIVLYRLERASHSGRSSLL